MKRVESFLTALLQLTMTFSLANSSAATCLQEQVASCRQAAVDSNMGQIAGGGECKIDSYVHYTHECKVRDYLPSIDFCCCQLEAKVMCCRYHQSWDRFRCSEADDTIDQAQPTTLSLPLPLEMFVPAIVGPLVFVICCIFCCTKCFCHRNYADEEDGTDCFTCCSSKSCSRCCSRCCSCSSPRCSSCCKDDDERGQRHLEKNGAPSPDEHVPLTYPNLLHQHSHQSQHVISSQSSVEGMSNGSTKLLRMSSSGPRVEPSAPPTVLMDDVFLHNDYAIYGGSIASSAGGGGNNNPASPSVVAADSSNHNIPHYASPQHRLCASCSSAIIVPPPAPPTYEESEGQKVEST